MQFYLIRHAEAAPLGAQGVMSDAERLLTPNGQQQARLVGLELQRRQVKIEVVLSSPLLRAWQTAQGMLTAWGGPTPEIRICEDLAPGGRVKRLAKLLRSLQQEHIALVGHMPDLAEMLGWFIGGKNANLTLAKAGIACLASPPEVRKRSATLHWLITPEWLEQAKPFTEKADAVSEEPQLPDHI